MKLQASFPIMIRNQKVRIEENVIFYFQNGIEKFFNLKEVSDIEVQKVYWFFPVWGTYDIRFTMHDGGAHRILNITKVGSQSVLELATKAGVKMNHVTNTWIFGSLLGSFVRSASMERVSRNKKDNYLVLIIILIMFCVFLAVFFS